MWLRRILRNSKGAAAVEAAFIFPILIYILIGVVQFGMIYNSTLVADEAAREIARNFAIMGGENEAVASHIIESYFGSGDDVLYGGYVSDNIVFNEESIEITEIGNQEMTRYDVEITYYCPIILPGADRLVGSGETFAGMIGTFEVNGAASFNKEAVDW